MTWTERALTIAAIALMLTCSAHAQTSDDERARGHFQAGTSYFDQGRYAESAGQFDEAYRLSRRAPLLANASVAYERAGDVAHAIERLEAYLATDAPDTADTRVTASARLESLRERLREEQARTATVEEPDSTEPTAVDAPPTSSGGRGSRIGAVVLGGTALAFGVASLGFGLRARSVHAELVGACGPGGASCPADRADDIRRGRRDTTLARVSTGLAVASAGAGAVFLGLSMRGRDDTPAVAATLDVGPGHVALLAFGRFR